MVLETEVSILIFFADIGKKQAATSPRHSCAPFPSLLALRIFLSRDRRTRPSYPQVMPREISLTARSEPGQSVAFIFPQVFFWGFCPPHPCSLFNLEPHSFSRFSSDPRPLQSFGADNPFFLWCGRLVICEYFHVRSQVVAAVFLLLNP